MTVLVINCGSSSVKYQLVDTDATTPIAKGQVERIGSDGDGAVTDHAEALVRIAEEVASVLDRSGATLVAVGHRVVHGGGEYSAPEPITDDVLAAIERLAVLAPLHNPANAFGIRAAMTAFPGVAQVAVFDTAFHETIPEANRTYAVPRGWQRDYGVRRYGFHGTSHAYVSREATAWLADHRGIAPGQAKVVVAHLGNGASACAVLGGRSVDTSMGLTPLPGLVMGTRSGDVDPAVFGHMDRAAGMSAPEVEAALNRDSGLLGLCGDADMRAVEHRADAGDRDAELALEVYTQRIRSTVGSYVATLGGLDALAFTAGIGENSVGIRRRVVEGLGVFGLTLDAARNGAAGGGIRPITTDASSVAALVIPTDEEGEIARQALAVVEATST